MKFKITIAMITFENIEEALFTMCILINIIIDKELLSYFLNFLICKTKITFIYHFIL